MERLTLEVLTEAASAGGPSCLTSRTELRPAAGPEASVAPAKFVSRGRDSAGAYAYETRYLDGQLRNTVVLDSKQSQLNRAEAAIVQAIEEGSDPLTRTPRITVDYGGELFSDLTLPHRAFDGHIRAGTVGGQPTTATDRYRQLRDASPLNARPLLETSPATLVFGGWDSSRKSRQGRWRSALVGEITGFTAGDATSGRRPEGALRGGARVDPVGMRVQLSGDVMAGLVDAQADEMSAKTVADLRAESAKATRAGRELSGSPLGLGGIPPTLDALAGVACDRIIRAHVLSFATLRQIRFGGDARGDAACRALLAAFALAALARSDAELVLRANCDLVEAGPTTLQVDRRRGRLEDFEALDVDTADALLTDAIAQAEQRAGIVWNGVALEVVGNPKVVGGAVEDSTS